MSEKLTMVWSEGEVDPHLPHAHRKGLSVEIMLAGEVLFRHAVTQEAHKYRRSDCVKHIFYWLIDHRIFEQFDMSPLIGLPVEGQVEIPF